MVSKDADARRQYGVLRGMVVPLIGALVNLWLMSKLDINAFILGLIWLSIGLAQLAYLTRFFRREPPEVAFDESEPESAPASVKATL
nr:amino acid permease C-terminal domain-containing protein [Halomonas glaciei]